MKADDVAAVAVSLSLGVLTVVLMLWPRKPPPRERMSERWMTNHKHELEHEDEEFWA